MNKGLILTPLKRPNGLSGILAYAAGHFLEFHNNFYFFLKRQLGQLGAPGALLRENPLGGLIFQ
jgi:hypothetical protein